MVGDFLIISIFSLMDVCHHCAAKCIISPPSHFNCKLIPQRSEKNVKLWLKLSIFFSPCCITRSNDSPPKEKGVRLYLHLKSIYNHKQYADLWLFSWQSASFFCCYFPIEVQTFVSSVLLFHTFIMYRK